MSDTEARRWAEMAGSDTATSAPPAPPAASGPAPTMPAMDTGKKGKKEKVKKEKRQKPPKVPSASRSRSTGDIPLLDLGRETRSREQLMQEGAEDLMAALGNSYSLLHAEVPDSSSPDDAQRKIEAQLGNYERDPDNELPGHPIYEGDSLVYHQLRRHYGLVQPGNTQGRLGGFLRRRESIHKPFTSGDERGVRQRY